MKSKVTVLIADDHAMVRAGIAAILPKADCTIVAEAGNGTEAVQETISIRPDIVLLDVRMPEHDGLWALEQIRDKVPEQKVIMLSMFSDRHYLSRCVELKANDFLLKDAPSGAMLETILRVWRGEEPPESSILRTIKRVRRKSPAPTQLTNREVEVLRHIARGRSNTEIGKSLGISAETVKEHVANLINKIDVRDRTQAAVWAVRNGLV